MGTFVSQSVQAKRSDFFICDRILRNEGITAVQRGQRAHHFDENVAFVIPDAVAPQIIGSAHVPGEGLGYREVRLGVYVVGRSGAALSLELVDKSVVGFVVGREDVSAVVARDKKQDVVAQVRRSFGHSPGLRSKGLLLDWVKFVELMQGCTRKR